MIVIPVFVVYSFFIAFFHFFLVFLKLLELHKLIQHGFGSYLCFLLCYGESQKQNKAKIAYVRNKKDGRLAR